MTTRWRCPPRVNSAPAARPTASATSAVIGARFAVPRIPSVPNRERFIGVAVVGIGGATLQEPRPRREAGLRNALELLRNVTHCRPQRERLDGFGNVVDAHHVGAPIEPVKRERER